MSNTTLIARQRKLAAMLSLPFADAPVAAAPAPAAIKAPVPTTPKRAVDPARKPRFERPRLELNADGWFGPTLEIKVLVVKEFARRGWEDALLTFRGEAYEGARGGKFYRGRVYVHGRYIGSADWYVSALKPFTVGNRSEHLRVTLANTDTPVRLGLKYEFVLAK